MVHKCHADGCQNPVRPELFMCKRHWNVVPAYIQEKIRKHYQPGQCDGKVRPSIEYFNATRQARLYIKLLAAVDDDEKKRFEKLIAEAEARREFA